MAKKSESEVVEPGTSVAVTNVKSQMPDFMKGQEGTSLQSLTTYVRPSRIKVIQKMAREPYKSKFKESDVILVPEMGMVAPAIWLPGEGQPEKLGTPFFITPIFFYPEFIAWNPLELKGTLDSVHERSTDPHSQLAAKCMRKELWYEDIPADIAPPAKGKGPWQRRNVEHLNFVVVISGEHEFADIPILLSYSKASHKLGTAFAGAIRMRGSMYGSNFMARASYADNQHGSWYGIACENPPMDSGVSPFVTDPERYKANEKLHYDLAEAHRKGTLQADLEDDDGPAPADGGGRF